ncbi:MAG: COX15/CtaA family protein [Pyrinomonadaceae bacterium]
MKSEKYAKLVWFSLVFNVIVVVWGVFLRASKSGDGCGKFWLTCQGEVIPSAPEFKTVIEFSHRLMSGLDFFLMLAVFLIAVLYFKKDRQIIAFASLAFLLIITEAAIGAGLVLTGNVATTHTDSRPLWAVGHLINTFLLLGSISVLGALLSSGKRFAGKASARVRLFAFVGTLLLLFVGVTGAVAALTNMLYPSDSVIEALLRDFDPASAFILRIRILHPIGAVITAVFVGFLAGWFKSAHEGSKEIGFWSGIVTLSLVLQVILGGTTILLGAPIVLQLAHLILADAVWIGWIMLCAHVFLGSETRITDKV